MSFLSDLFEGNFSNLGTDLSHAPSSFVQDLPSEEPYLIGAGVLAGGALLGPEILPALGLTDAAAGGAAAATDLGVEAGTDLSAQAGLDAASASFGSFDPTAFAAESGDLAAGGDAALAGGDVAATGDLAATAAGGDAIAGAVDPAVAAATDLAPLGSDTLAFADPAALGGSVDPVANLSDVSGFLSDPGAAGTMDTSVPSDLLSLQAPTDSTGAGGTGSFASDLAGGSFDQAPPAPGTSGSFGDQLASGSFDQAPGAGTTAAANDSGGISSALHSALGSDYTKLALAAAPLALTLLRGEPSLPAQDQTATANANQLSSFGQQQLAMGQAGTLNSSQMAYLQNMQNNLTNQALQTMYNMGVTDPTRDSRWPQMQANIQLQISAQTQAFIQQEIQNGLSALGASSSTLTQVAAQQMQSDQQFTNNLVQAVSAGARVLSTAGTKTTTTTTTSA